MIEPVNFNPMLSVVIKYLEELEKTFLVYLGCKDEVNYCSEAVNSGMQASLAEILESAEQILAVDSSQCSIMGLERLWLKALVKRCDSIERSSKEIGSFACWINETDGVEIWWILRHGLPSLKQVGHTRNLWLSSGLDLLLKEGKDSNPLSAMWNLTEKFKDNNSDPEPVDLVQTNDNSYLTDILAGFKRRKIIEEFESLAGDLILIAIDQYCVKSQLSEDDNFVQIIMESLSCGDNSRIFFLELVEKWLPYYSYSNSFSSNRLDPEDNFIAARVSKPEIRFRHLADALAA